MAQLVVRNLEEHVKAGLLRRAQRNNRSMEEEVRTILRRSVLADEGPPSPPREPHPRAVRGERPR